MVEVVDETKLANMLGLGVNFHSSLWQEEDVLVHTGALAEVLES